MKKVSVKIKLRAIKPGDPEEVTVMGYEFIPGLFIHRSIEWGTYHQTERDYWAIHHKSGYMVCDFGLRHSRKSILEPAVKFLGNLNWTWDQLPADTKEYAEAVLQLKAEINSLPRYRR